MQNGFTLPKQTNKQKKNKPHGNFKATYINELMTGKPVKQPLQRNQINGIK